jgi:hypothetical protein
MRMIEFDIVKQLPRIFPMGLTVLPISKSSATNARAWEILMLKSAFRDASTNVSEGHDAQEGDATFGWIHRGAGTMVGRGTVSRSSAFMCRTMAGESGKWSNSSIKPTRHNRSVTSTTVLITTNSVGGDPRSCPASCLHSFEEDHCEQNLCLLWLRRPHAGRNVYSIPGSDAGKINHLAFALLPLIVPRPTMRLLFLLLMIQRTMLIGPVNAGPERGSQRLLWLF